MGDDPSSRNRGLRFQFTLWGLLWLVAVCSVSLAAFRGLGVGGLWIAGSAVFGAIVGHAFGGAIGTGRLRPFGAVLGGALGGTVGNGMWAAPIGFVTGLAIGACWLLLTVGGGPSAVGAESCRDSAGGVSGGLREMRRTLLGSALIVTAAGLMLASVLGIVSFATENPLDRWFMARRVFLFSAAVALVVALTLAASSLLLGLAERPPRKKEGGENQEDEDD